MIKFSVEFSSIKFNGNCGIIWSFGLKQAETSIWSFGLKQAETIIWGFGLKRAETNFNEFGITKFGSELQN